MPPLLFFVLPSPDTGRQTQQEPRQAFLRPRPALSPPPLRHRGFRVQGSLWSRKTCPNRKDRWTDRGTYNLAMWYIYKVIGQPEDMIGRFPTREEAEEYARQVRAKRPRSHIVVSPDQEEAYRSQAEKRQEKRGRRGQ